MIYFIGVLFDITRRIGPRPVPCSRDTFQLSLLMACRPRIKTGFLLRLKDKAR